MPAWLPPRCECCEACGHRWVDVPHDLAGLAQTLRVDAPEREVYGGPVQDPMPEETP